MGYNIACEGCLVQLLTEQDYFLIINGVVKIFGFLEFSSTYFIAHILKNLWLHCFQNT